jgi:hypothetical protein
MNDRTFERIQTLFDIALFADVKVLVVGCGSGDGNVALQLVMSGIRAKRSLSTAASRRQTTRPSPM